MKCRVKETIFPEVHEFHKYGNDRVGMGHEQKDYKAVHYLL